jgi:putative endonuclease
MYYVYVLYTEKFDKYYIGQTNNIVTRLDRHNSGYEIATKPYVPWEMMLHIEKATRQETMALEKKLKNLSKARIQIFIQKYRRC